MLHFCCCNRMVCCNFLWCCLFVRNVLFVMLHWCVLDDAVMAPRLKRHHRSRRSAAVSILPDLLHHCRSVIFRFESLSQELLRKLLILPEIKLQLGFVWQLNSIDSMRLNRSIPASVPPALLSLV